MFSEAVIYVINQTPLLGELYIFPAQQHNNQGYAPGCKRIREEHMFALKPRTELATRVLLIAVILFNAPGATTAAAQSLPSNEEADASSAPIASPLGINGRGVKLSTHSRSMTTFLQTTPAATPTGTAIETPTPEPFDTLRTTPSVTPTAATDGTPTTIVETSHAFAYI